MDILQKIVCCNQRSKSFYNSDIALSALNFLTGEGISYNPSGVDDGAILALIEDYFNTESRNESSDDASDHSTDEGTYKTLRINALTHQQLDLVLLGSVMSTTAVDKDVVRGRHRPAKRQQLSTG